MATVVDSLVITLGLDSKGVDQGMKQVEGRLKSGVSYLIGNVLAPLGGTLAFGALLNNFVRTGDELAKLSQRIRVDANDIQAWGSAVEAAGGSAEGLKGTLTMLSDRFRFMGNMKDPTKILTDLAKRAETMGSTQFRFFAKRFGIDEGTIALLQKGGKEVDKLVTKYKALSLTQKDVEAARKFKIAQNDLWKTVEAGAAIIMRIAVPAFEWMATALQTPINFLREHESFVIGFFVALAAVITAALIPSFGFLAVAVWTALAPLLPFAAAVLGLALLFDDLWVYIQGGESALGEFWSIFGSGEEILASLTAAWEFLKEVVGSFIDQVLYIYEPIVDVFRGMLKIIKGIFEGDFKAIGEGVRQIFDGLVEYIKRLFESILSPILAAIEWVKSNIPSLDSITSGITSAPGKILDAGKDFVSGLFGSEDQAASPAAASPTGFADPNAWMYQTGLGMGAAGAVSPALGNQNVSQSDTRVDIGSITVSTQATDAQGIAGDIGGALNRTLTDNSNMGVNRGM